MPRVRLVVLLVVAVLLTAAAPALAAPVTGQGSDPANDQATAGRDLTGVAAGYDAASGTVLATATFRGDPSAQDGATLVVILGTLDGTTCDYPAAGIGSTAGDQLSVAAWQRFDSGPTVSASGNDGTRTRSGTSVTLRVTTSSLASRAYDCVGVVQVVRDGTVLDQLDALFGLEGAGTPPTTTPTTPTTPTTTTPVPTTITTAPPPIVPSTPIAPVVPPVAPTTPPATTTPARSGANLVLSLPKPKAGRRNVTRATRVTVRNTGTATARRPVVRLTLPKGVRATRRSIALKDIAKGKARTATFRIRVGTKAKADATIRVTARTRTKGTASSVTGRLGLPVRQLTKKQRLAQALKACAKRRTAKQRAGCREAARATAAKETTSTTTPATTAPATTPTPATQPAASLAGRYFFYLRVDVLTGQTTKAFYFVDGQWAYRGVPKAGFPACSARTATVEPDGDPGDGCVPYTFDPATRALTIDGQPATIDPNLLRITAGEDDYDYKPIPPTGSRWDLSLKAIEQTGVAPFNATVTTRYLDMNGAGQFNLGSESIGTFGGGAGNPGGGNFAVTRPDSQGTYEVLPGGVLLLSFADGHVDRYSIAIDRNATTGDVSAPTAGLLLDDGFFFKDDD